MRLVFVGIACLLALGKSLPRHAPCPGVLLHRPPVCIVCLGPCGMSTSCRYVRSSDCAMLAGRTLWARVFVRIQWVPRPEVWAMGRAACRNCLCRLVFRHHHVATLMVAAPKRELSPWHRRKQTKIHVQVWSQISLDTSLRRCSPAPTPSLDRGQG